MSGNGKKNITATILEKVARNSVKAAGTRSLLDKKAAYGKKLPYM